MNESWYISQKTLGPEFYEADITMLLTFIFRNSIWLGAKSRGKALPDSVSTFPIEKRKRGCFISDVKFTLGKGPDIGPKNKNLKYIKDGIKNQSIKDNGGLRGFVFISNRAAPSNFIDKLSSIVKRRLIKAAYFTGNQILLIYKHLKLWEHEMNIDHRKKGIFLNSMESIFLTPESFRKMDKIVIWTESKIQQVLNQNDLEYKKFRKVSINV